MVSTITKTAMAVGVAAATMVAGSVGALAQGLLFDWGGEQNSGGSGKEVVAFRGGVPGELIASFGDRKLYYVTAPRSGIGLSDRHPARPEPLVRRDQRVAEAREPELDADSDHARGKPAPADVGTGRPSA